MEDSYFGPKEDFGAQKLKGTIIGKKIDLIDIFNLCECI